MLDGRRIVIVIKTLPGSAGMLATMLDGAGWPEIIGTVAGYDNVLAVVKPSSATSKVMERLQRMVNETN